MEQHDPPRAGDVGTCVSIRCNQRARSGPGSSGRGRSRGRSRTRRRAVARRRSTRPDPPPLGFEARAAARHATLRPGRGLGCARRCDRAPARLEEAPLSPFATPSVGRRRPDLPTRRVRRPRVGCRLRAASSAPSRARRRESAGAGASTASNDAQSKATRRRTTARPARARARESRAPARPSPGDPRTRTIARAATADRDDVCRNPRAGYASRTLRWSTAPGRGKR